MGIKPKTPKRQIEQYTLEQIRKKEQEIIETLLYIGEKCVNDARTKGGYTDRTGNLRNSIGYVVIHDGNVVSPMSFKGGKGAEEGQKFIDKLKAHYKKGFTLIVVAGMSYASYVEAKGLNVLASSELKAIDMTPRMLRKIGIK